MTALERLEGKSAWVPFCGCRLWYGGSVPKGYGVMFFEGRQQYTHRIAWQLERGPIPNGAHVLHKCDVPACSNADHLFLGSAADNMADMVRKGRQGGGAPRGDANPMRIHKGLLAGERSGQAKLTAVQVAEIRRAYADGVTQVALARTYSVRQGHISRIIRGESWAHHSF